VVATVTADFRRLGYYFVIVISPLCDLIVSPAN
jgi:hypothetical protein